jgi:hypothetical protein
MSQTEMIAGIKQHLMNYGSDWHEKKGFFSFSTIIAERKAFLSTKKLTYSLRLRIDDTTKVVHFSEMLAESGSGFSTGSDFDSRSSGFGFKTESFNTFHGSRKGGIEEQSTLFGKDYSYRFNYQDIRQKVQETAQNFGYSFVYQILPVK